MPSAVKSLFRILLLLSFCVALIFVVIARPAFVNKKKDESLDYVDPFILQRHVMFLSTTAAPRSFADPYNLNRVADYIHSNFSQQSANVSFQHFQAQDIDYKNVIAEFGPKSDNVIVIGAHYDAYSDLPGADDNASGIAGLLELARLFNTLKFSAASPQIILEAYSLEEPPYFASEKMGSYIHAESLQGKNVELMISLEMIGYFSEEQDSQTYPLPIMHLFYPDKGNFIAVVDGLMTNNARALKMAVNEYTSLSAYSINAPAVLKGVNFSDHRNYWAFGYPAVMLTDTSFYRNTAYHTPEDTYERLHYPHLARVVYGVFKFIEQKIGH